MILKYLSHKLYCYVITGWATTNVLVALTLMQRHHRLGHDLRHRRIKSDAMSSQAEPWFTSSSHLLWCNVITGRPWFTSSLHYLWCNVITGWAMIFVIAALSLMHRHHRLGHDLRPRCIITDATSSHAGPWFSSSLHYLWCNVITGGAMIYVIVALTLMQRHHRLSHDLQILLKL